MRECRSADRALMFLPPLLGISCSCVEVKRADAPKTTPSQRTPMVDLGLARVAVVYPRSRRYSLGEDVEVVPVAELAGQSGLFG